ncbi:MAG: DotU family type IV/VI secretion system protein [Candidatus Latescibacteria bacterium]|nr:DotU family type IV/VI secretion system protein [Candidatus Latescibacterota bacterium]
MRLVDCFYELFYYTLFLKGLNFSQFTYSKVADHYKNLFKRSLITARKEGFSQDEWGKGFFAVCAWIDETILCSGWSGRSQWERYPLQLYFYKTTMAGEEFYSRLSKLGNHEKSIMEVYFYCLALGFKGRFFPSKYAGKLNSLKKALMKQFFTKEDPAFPGVLFPEGYSLSRQSKKGMHTLFGIPPYTLMLGILPPALFFALFVYFKNTLAALVSRFF